jgi:hypothetical protein
MGSFAACAGLAVLGLLGCTGGGESVISGLGNSGNHIGTAALWQALAEELAEHGATPAVSDEDVRAVFDVIRRHALEGELDAALVLLRLAAEQGEAEE